MTSSADTTRRELFETAYVHINKPYSTVSTGTLMSRNTNKFNAATRMVGYNEIN